MRGQIVIRRKNRAVIEVTSIPLMKGIGAKFYRPIARKPFDRALGYAARMASIFQMELVDETGAVAPEMCAALVAELAERGVCSR